MRSRVTPEWAKKYLRYAALSQWEALNLLCGLPPSPAHDTPVPADTPVPTFEAQTDRYAKEEGRRQDALRHVRDALATGALRLLASPEEQLLEKFRQQLTPHAWQELNRVIGLQRARGTAYVTPDALIRWADSRRDHLFPDLAGSVDDLPRSLEEPDTRKLTSLRLIIAALADHAKVDIRQPSKAAKTIGAAAQRLGVRLHRRTITSHLKDVQDALNRPER